MILKMIHLLIVAILCIHGSVARGLYEDLEEFNRWERQGIPGTSAPEYAPDCIKDILVLWDNSYSIGIRPFTVFIKPFIRDLINSPQLNVGSRGTHIGVVSFSTQANTRVLWNVSAYPNREDLLNAVERLEYRTVKGDGTRTGMAFKIANELFSKPNPLNYRENVGDVVVLFSDGRPTVRRHLGEDKFGFKTETLMASYYANKLKKNNVTIVSLAVGHDKEIDKFYDDIVSWSTSKDHVFKAKLTDLETVLNRLVSVSCIDPGQCTCPGTFTDVFLKQGEERAAVSWLLPSLQCSSRQPNIYHTEVTPKGAKSGQSFGAGQHNITYKFTYQKGARKTYQECPVIINVHACECPAQQTVHAVIRPGESTAFASWREPTPTCKADIKYKEFEKTEGWFGEGKHKALYVYSRENQGKKFEILCEVKIDVEACKCPPEQTIKVKVQPGKSKAYASWKEPKPTCKSTLTYSEHETTDGWFSVGFHSAPYVYKHGNGFDIRCAVNIEVEGELCRGKAFNSDTQVCCCGETHEKRPEHECCGMEYYDKSKSQCCDKEKANVMPPEENCPMNIV